MNEEKVRKYIGDAALALSAGWVFIVQGTSENPSLVVMGLCVLALTGRTAFAVKHLLGGERDTSTMESLSSSEQPGSQPGSSPSSSR